MRIIRETIAQYRREFGIAATLGECTVIPLTLLLGLAIAALVEGW